MAGKERVDAASLRSIAAGRGLEGKLALTSSPLPRHHPPRPSIDHELCRRCQDQRRERCLRERAHRPLDQHRVDHGARDDHGCQGQVTGTPDRWVQAQAAAEGGEEGCGEDGPHGDHAPGGEGGG